MITKLTRLLLILFFGPMFSYTATGQSKIKGRVQSSISQLRPITEVYIKILNIDRPVIDRMVMADSLGYFQFENLELNKTYRLEISAFGYDRQLLEVETTKTINDTTLVIEASCEYSKEQADNDWKNGMAKLLIIGSIAPIANTPEDKLFEKKYGVEFYDFGCTPPIDECIKLYNEGIFELLDKKFETNWRNKIRTDVEYL
ncbi:carboxypeptidase-like regulatory domain-containing protein [Carboxylicivirga taeanensis]|uniref:carboxypeptidase-like regulatory domain-containing protein n=1 Tax=Carboxylicivirga taeanensis TaxID=1416875 RepID=UPI003F6DCD25